ncbi:MAG: chemotaxis protein CheA [Acidobacteriia bacterium]|nr:chemotaxis protein CheA [Terriglobia bacterium]
MEIQRDLILKSFLVESEDSLAQMEQAVLELERSPENDELIQAIFRVVHTAKGNAAMLELQSLLAFAHTLEDFLDALRGHRLAVTRDVSTVLLSSVDVLREMTTAAGEGKDKTTRRAETVLQSISRHLKDVDGRGKEPTHGPDDSAAGPETFSSTPAAATTEGGRTLRVDVSKLDRLLDLMGEITIARGRVAQLLENKEHIDLDAIREAHRFTDTLHTELQETVLKTRMVPVGPLMRQYARTVRDLSKSHGKLAQLHLEGEDVEVDTSVVEHLRDPLLHMIRNAIDHGIERPSVRRKKGKAAIGIITVKAAHKAGSIVIEVSDDGAGLDRQKIVDMARKRALAAEPEKLSDHDVYQLIFESGFSTVSQVSDLSGRGVGMDVIRRNVQALRGSVYVSSRPGAGASVHISLPLTLAMIEGFGVGVGNETCIIPVDQVIECVELTVDEDQAGRREGVLQLRGEPLPYLHLKDHFGFGGDRALRQNIIVVQHDSCRAGLAVDLLYGSTQTVIKPLPPIFKDVPGVSGSAILGNGRVALILDVPMLLRDFQMQASGPA